MIGFAVIGFTLNVTAFAMLVSATSLFVEGP